MCSDDGLYSLKGISLEKEQMPVWTSLVAALMLNFFFSRILGLIKSQRPGSFIEPLDAKNRQIFIAGINNRLAIKCMLSNDKHTLVF